jgi:hypothetical protein
LTLPLGQAPPSASMTHRPFTRRCFHRAASSRRCFQRPASSQLAAAATISGLGTRGWPDRPLWLGLAAIATVIALAWHAVGTVPDAPHHSGAQRAIR